MAVLLIAVLIALAAALSFTLGVAWIAILPVLLVLGIVVWGATALGGRRSPSSVVRDTEKPELLGPGGPDDPDASR